MSDTTEVEAAAKLAAEPETFEAVPGDVELIACPPGWNVTVFDHEALANEPRRTMGAITVRDAAGFVTAVNQRKTGPVALYADEAGAAPEHATSIPKLVAVLNDDHGGTPGWRDHVVSLELRYRPEWIHWMSGNGRLMPQQQFALHVEDGLQEIVQPSPADMLDLAQHFHATTNAKFRGGQRIATGERQFMYDEEVAAKAGAQGQITIPDSFTLLVAPFFGTEAAQITAAFRFQLRSSELSLGYKLDRPDEVERAAFRLLSEAVAQELEVPLIAGVAPRARGNSLPQF